MASCARTKNQVLRSRAEQFCSIKVPALDKPRAYSLACAPRAEFDGEHRFFARLVNDGKFSRWLALENRVGASVELSGPLGKFLRDESAAPMICIAGGSGMSAIFSIIGDAQLSNTARDCYFFYGASSEAGLYLTKEIFAIKDRWHPRHRFDYHLVLSDAQQASTTVDAYSAKSAF